MKTATARTNRFVLMLLGCLLVSLIVVGSACRRQESPTPEEDAASPLQTPPAVETPETDVDPTLPEPRPVAVTVNGEEISEAQVQAQLNYYLRSSPELANLPDAFVAQFAAQIRPQVLDGLISRTLLLQEARAADMEVTDEEVLALLEQQGATQHPPITVEQFKQMVAAQGGNFEQVKNEFKENLMLERFVQERFGDQIEASEDEAKAFYDENRAEFDEPEQVQASHILVRFPDPVDPDADPNEVKAATKAQAQALLDQIEAGGDFAALAQAHSMDPGSAIHGGDLGFFPRGIMVPPFEEAAFGQEPNEVSDLVETQFGYHIVKTTGHKDARTVPFEEVEADIIEELRRQGQVELIQEYVQSLKEQATIVYPPGSEPQVPANMMGAPSTSAPAPIDEGSLEPVEPDVN